MNVTVQEISSIQKQLSIEVPAERVNSEIAKVYEKLAKSAKLKGFRKGKIPRPVLEKHYRGEMEIQVLNNLFSATYYAALTDNKIPAVSGPELVDASAVAADTALTYVAKVEVRPEISAAGYTGLALKKEAFTADESVVEERIKEMCESRAEQAPVSRRKTAREGDFAVIDFTGYLNDEAFQGGTAENYSLELGSGSFIPGFEDQVVGMKIDEEKDINVTFPENYGSKELAGQPVVFKVTLKDLKEKKVPEMDDELAKEFGAESAADLREKVRADYVKQEQGRVDGQLREAMVDALLEANEFEVPESMINNQLDYMIENTEARLKAQGMNMQMLGMNPDVFRSLYREQAVKQLKGGLILDAIRKQEKIDAEESALDAEFDKIAEMTGAPLEQIKKYYEKGEARASLLANVAEEKTVEFILSKATVTEVAKEELAAGKAEKE